VIKDLCSLPSFVKVKRSKEHLLTVLKDNPFFLNFPKLNSAFDLRWERETLYIKSHEFRQAPKGQSHFALEPFFHKYK
jgi:hypothetical protein